MNTNDHKQGHKDTNFLNLSASELSVLHNKEFYKLKRQSIEKIVASFADLESTLTHSLSELRGESKHIDFRQRGNISKGENYLGLPYVVLDHPAVFGRDGIFAFRTMFWWGNGFSTTFHASGVYLKCLSEDFYNSILMHTPDQYLIGTGKGEWDHHFEKNNFTSVRAIKLQPKQLMAEVNNRGFFKIADKWEIDQANDTPQKVLGFLRILFDALNKS